MTLLCFSLGTLLALTRSMLKAKKSFIALFTIISLPCVLILTHCKGSQTGTNSTVQQPLVSMILTSQQQIKSLLASEARGGTLTPFLGTPSWFEDKNIEICGGVVPVYFDLSQATTPNQPLISHDLIGGVNSILHGNCLGAMTERNLYTIRQNYSVNAQNPSEAEIVAYDAGNRALLPAVVYSGEIGKYELQNGTKIDISVIVHPPVTRIMDAYEEVSESEALRAAQMAALITPPPVSDDDDSKPQLPPPSFQNYGTGPAGPFHPRPASYIAVFVETEVEDNGMKQKKQGIKVMKLEFSVVNGQRQVKVIDKSFISLPDSLDQKNPQWWDMAVGNSLSQNLAPGYWRPNTQLIMVDVNTIYFAVTSINPALVEPITTFYRYQILSKKTDRMLIIPHNTQKTHWGPPFPTEDYDPASFSYDEQTNHLIWATRVEINAVQTNLMAYDSDPKNTETNLIENLGKIDFDFTTLKKSQTMMNVTSTDNLIPSDIIYSNEFDKFFGISKSYAPNIVMGQIMVPPLSFFKLHDLGNNLSTFPNAIYDSKEKRLIHLQTVKKN